jgi:hypothetical protein
VAQFGELLDGRFELFFESVGFCAQVLDAHMVCLVFGNCTILVSVLSQNEWQHTLIQSFTELVVSSYQVDCSLRGWVVGGD